MSNLPSNRERYELRRFGPPSYKYTDLTREHQPKQQTAPHTTLTSTHHTAPNMHEAEEGNPPPPQQRATDNLAPEYFKGLSSENADLWMTTIENWRSYRLMNEEQTKAAIPLFFRDGAAHWYQALADDKKGTLPHLKAAFKERYQAQHRDKWKRAAELCNLHQTANQPVADFLTNIEMLAKKAGLGDAQTVFTAVNGLTPVLRQAVHTKEANTMETVRKWATVAEGAVDSNPSKDIDSNGI